jgi:DNA-binding response OmpR family regulator
MMPEMDGYEVIRQLKESKKTRDIPVIFLTSMSSGEDETRGFGLGAGDYIKKPFNPEIVKARVKTHRTWRRRINGWLYRTKSCSKPRNSKKISSG